MADLSGVVVVNKPSGPTSFDVVRRVKGLYKVKRVGHTGTLDPTATGVLPICVGAATKVAGFIAEGEKEYEATVRFGQITDTQDSAGRVLETRPVNGLSEDRVREALRSFVGLIEQTPPMYSARKVEGKRLYELARVPRAVNIDEARVTFFQPPDCGIFVRCSKGTYLRTLAHDLGMRLGCGAHLRDMRRVRVGPFGIDESVGLDELMAAAKESRDQLTRYLKPPDRALADLAELRMDPQLSRRV